MEEEIKLNPKLTSRDSSFLLSKKSKGLKLLAKQDKKLGRKSIAEKQREISYDHIIQILVKPKNSRNLLENKLLAEYLSQKFDYFQKIKNSEPSKLEKLCKLLNFETFSPKETIINFGEPGDKFYIVFKGKVGVYKPIYKEKEMSVNDFYSYIIFLKKSKKIYKMNRIMEKNQHLNLDLEIMASTPEDSFYMRKILNFIIEEEEKLGEFSSGFTFGEMALIKKTKRNATVIALNPSTLLSIEKYDYNNVIRRLEEKRLEKEICKFRLNYPLFFNWSNFNILDFFNCFQHLRLTQGEFLYKQNDESDCIYLIKEGIFEMFSDISFAWLTNFFEYIINSDNNLLKKLESFHPKNESDLINMIDKIKLNLPSCPSIVNRKFKKLKKPQNFGENVFDIKLEEDELNNPENLFRIFIKKIDYKDIIGLEDSLELKKRFCSVKCVSSVSYVEKVKLIYFLKLINTFKIESKARNVLQQILQEKKMVIVNLIKNSVKNKVSTIEEDFEKKYNTIIEKNLDKENEESKNIQISTIKLRGWTKDLDYILDENIHFHKYPRVRSLSKDIEKKIFGLKSHNEKIFHKINYKTINPVIKNKITSPENNHYKTLLSPIKKKRTKFRVINLSNSISKINKNKYNNTDLNLDSINYSERNKKKKNIILNINQNLTRNNFHRNTELYYFPSSSSPNIIESEKEKKNIRKKLFLESFSAGEKIFFLYSKFYYFDIFCNL